MIATGELVSHHYMTTRGVTFRQLDYWTRTGRIRAVDAGRGSGSPRHWPIGEAQVAVVIAKLGRAGLTLDAAERVARGGRLAEDIDLVIRDSA